eukprot:6186395-Pleurochrysis_carterae.AAC.7
MVYVLFCGEGAFSRGAVLAGARVVGFDITDRPCSTFGMRTVSQLGVGKFERTPIPEMRYMQQDLIYAEFWQHLETKAYAPDRARRNAIHANPPCKEHSGLRF